MSATTLPKGVLAVAITYEHTRLSGLNDAELVEAAEADEHAHSIGSIASPAVAFAYGVTGDLSLAVRLPYVKRRDIREGEHGEEGGHGHGAHSKEAPHGEDHAGEAIARGDSDGIGDLSLLAQWRVLNNEAAGNSAALLFGVKAPTGRTDQDDVNGERFEAEFQAGSGSWDGQFGVAVTQRLGAWSLDANVLYTVVGNGVQSTDLGDRFHYNAAVSYRALGAAKSFTHKHADGTVEVHSEPATGPAVDLVLEFNGEWHDKQDIAGLSDENSGGNVAYIAPGVRLSMDKWSGFVSVGVPVINNLNGLQSEPDVRFTTGVGLSF